MSAYEKITAIADNIRSLLGVTEKMGLDAMATNLQIEQANINNAFIAIGNKGGTIPSSKISGNLASAIDSISSAPPPYTGDLYTFGTATVTPNSGVSQVQFTNIPKEPDLFVIYVDSFDINQYHRAGVVVYDGETVYGQEYYTSGDCYFNENVNSASDYYWRYTYSGTTLTIASSSNSKGGYFHNPGTYTLLYAYKDNENGNVAIGKQKVTSAGGASLAFTELDGEPVWYSTILRGNQDAQAASANTVVFANEKGYSHMTNASSAKYAFNATTSHDTYTDGTLTIAPSGTTFSANEYSLIYAWNPNPGTDIGGDSNVDGIELNFEVVGGTTQPTNPKENTIWVNTSTAITNWYFSATQPSSTVSGDVWFTVGVSSKVAFNALKENNLTVYPVSAKQYVKSGWSGSWNDVTVKFYQNGKWNEWNMMLFNGGEKFTSITGGWQISHCYAFQDSVYGGNYCANTPTLHDGDGVLAIYGYPDNDVSGLLHTKNKIDLTPYKTLKMDGAMIADRDVIGTGIYIRNNITEAYYESNYVARYTPAEYNVEESGIFEIDISSITGSYYICLACCAYSTNVSQVGMNSMWLE